MLAITVPKGDGDSPVLPGMDITQQNGVKIGNGKGLTLFLFDRRQGDNLIVHVQFGDAKILHRITFLAYGRIAKIF